MLGHSLLCYPITHCLTGDPNTSSQELGQYQSQEDFPGNAKDRGIKRRKVFQVRSYSKITKIQTLQTEVILVSCLLKYEVHYPKMTETWISASSKPESEWAKSDDYGDDTTIFRPSEMWQIIPIVSLIDWAGQCVLFHRHSVSLTWNSGGYH